MTLQNLTWAWEQELPPTQKLVLISLADHANQDGECWPSINRLAKFTGLGRTAIKTNLKKLEDAGFITAEQRLREDGGHTSHLYHLNNPLCRGVPYPMSGGDHAPMSGGDHQEHSTLEHSNKPANQNGFEFESESTHKPTAEQIFEEWWKGVPKKVGKDDAFKAFKSVLPKTDIETLTAARDKWAGECVGKDQTYIKHPASWLRGGYWRPPESAPAASRPVYEPRGLETGE